MNKEFNTEQDLPFEKAFARLEEILEKLNSSSVSLDESLKLYEEADKLISTCTTRLNSAEQKIEALIKNRDGTVAEINGLPQTEEFSAN